MAENTGVVFLGQNKVEVQSIDFPKMQNPAGKKINHAVILKVVSTNICGSDQHKVRGRTTAPPGLVLGYESTGEVIEKGADVEFLDIFPRSGLATLKLVEDRRFMPRYAMITHFGACHLGVKFKKPLSSRCVPGRTAPTVRRLTYKA